MFADRHNPPYKTAGAALLAVVAVLLMLIALQFRGAFQPKAQLTLVSARAGLVLDPGSKVTYNGVPIGRVAGVSTVNGDDLKARVVLDIDPRYLNLLPANVETSIQATTVFGNKYVAFRSPQNPSAERVSTTTPIDVSAVTTEFNTLFETITAISEQVDPIKLNQTLSATAQALSGLGDKFGRSLVDGNAILDDLNPRMPQLRHDISALADLGDVYAGAAPDLFDGLAGATRTAATFNAERDNIDSALMAAIGFAGTGADIAERGGPYLQRGAQDLLPTSKLLDEYQGEILCMIRNYHDVAPELNLALGGDNGYSLASSGTLYSVGSANAYVYPDNLPRVNAHGGPEGKPGCWQKITRDLWPAPYLVMDTGLSIAPYNHFELGSPMFTDYVWGRQIGEPTINP
ncbi:MCE family protein [Mycolicibacterium brisbanense]|uniref:MCE-family protein MCE1a n=1 Tax=Mycolicibacterium brisbanense TaxID=146020 RepID=A0A117I7X4_9MYCO|nr:MCE family protein [Mycolicibacterium brisbanense]MCV7159527.1 MCE family protein [Mycolicibacterium brisbanense]GAS92315.1 MCE-family protein MCE1a [Mycolicibacterium brisbanense]